MRECRIAAIIAAVGLVLAGCGGGHGGLASSSTATSATPPPPPVAPAALANLLLTPAEVDGVLGTTGTAATPIEHTDDEAANQQWPGGYTFPAECLYAVGPAQTPVYANSGYTALRGDKDIAPSPPGSDDTSQQVTQVVAAFPSAAEANAFFSASAQRWPACANRQIDTPAGADIPPMNWKVAAVSNANATLSVAVTLVLNLDPNTTGSAVTNSCQRALTVRNNVAIDVIGCRKSPGDLAANVANQVGGKANSANSTLLSGSLSKGYNLTNCHPAATLRAPALAELDCGHNADPAGPASAVYRLLPNADALAADFAATTAGAALASCGPDTGQSPGKWQQGQATGQMACGTRTDAATVAWTTDGKNVLSDFGWPTNDINAMHQWWLANG